MDLNILWVRAHQGPLVSFPWCLWLCGLTWIVCCLFLCLCLCLPPSPHTNFPLWLVCAFSQRGCFRVVRLLPLWLAAPWEKDKSFLSSSRVGTVPAHHHFCSTLSVMAVTGLLRFKGRGIKIHMTISNLPQWLHINPYIRIQKYVLNVLLEASVFYSIE